MDAWTPTDGAGLLAAAVLLPFVAMLIGLALGGRWMQRVAFMLMPLQLGVSAAIAWFWLRGDTLVYLLGGWAPVRGLLVTAVITCTMPLVMMAPVEGDSLDPSVEARYRDALSLPAGGPGITRIDRYAFYERAQNAFAVVITGERAKYGNILLKKGVTP